MPLTIADYIWREELFEDGPEAVAFDIMSNPYSTRTYTRKFLVQLRRPDLGPQIACLCPGIPRPYSFYVTGGGGYDEFAICQKISGSPVSDSDGCWFHVNCFYSTDRTKIDPGNFDFPIDVNGNPTGGSHNNPELEVPEVEWDGEETVAYYNEDILGKPFLNSAWQPFQNPPGIPVFRPILTLTRSERDFNQQKMADFAGAVNDKKFMGYAKDSVLCMAPRVRAMFDKGPVPYWRVTYRLKFGYKLERGNREDGVWTEYESFQHRELDQGYAERKLVGDPVIVAGVGGAIASIDQKWQTLPIIPHGSSSQRPTLLNGEGLKQIRMVPDDEGNAAYPQPVYLDFTTRRRLDFTNLFKRGLGGTFPPKPRRG